MYSLTWTESTDDVGVAGYGVYRNGVVVADQKTRSFRDGSRLRAGRYTYAVRAYDRAGNLSGLLNYVVVTRS